MHWEMSHTYIFLMFFLYAVDDTSDGAFVQFRGRFKVTPADLSPMVCIKFLSTSILEPVFFVEVSKAVSWTFFISW